MKHISGSILLLTLLALAAASQAQPITHIYFGVGGFNVNYEREPSAYTGAFFGGTDTVAVTPEEDNDTGWHLVYGYQFRKHFAVEAQFFDAGKYSQRGTHVVNDAIVSWYNPDYTEARISYNGTTTTSVRQRGIAAMGVAILPLTQHFSLKAKLGFGFLNTTSEFRMVDDINADVLVGTPFEPGFYVLDGEQNETDIPLIVGAEASLRLGWDWGVSVFYQKISDVDGGVLSTGADLESAGIQVTFHY